MHQNFPAREVLVPALLVVIIFAGLLLSDLPAIAQSSHIGSVNPVSAKVGDVVHAAGGALGANAVDELYLTNGAQDVKIAMMDQSETAITFKVPTGVKPGRWALMIHLKGGPGNGLFEQPVKLTVE